MSNDLPADDTKFWARLQHIVNTSVADLPAEDRAERVAYCQRTGDQGVQARFGEAETEFWWGGRLLAVVPHDVFADDAYFAPLTVDFVDAAPDDVSGLDEP